MANRSEMEDSTAAAGYHVGTGDRLAAAAFAFAFATGAGRTLSWTGPPLYLLATTVAYSRIHTGVHYPGDVVIGALCGVTLAELTNLTLDRILAA